MRVVAHFFAWLFSWISSLFAETAEAVARLFERRHHFSAVDELPETPKAGIVYLAGEGENVWAASMVCPCGCRDVIELNLLPQVRPSWKATKHPGGTVTLYPSVWRQKNCRSHFILERGQIRWCP